MHDQQQCRIKQGFKYLWNMMNRYRTLSSCQTSDLWDIQPSSSLRPPGDSQDRHLLTTLLLSRRKNILTIRNLIRAVFPAGFFQGRPSIWMNLTCNIASCRRKLVSCSAYVTSCSHMFCEKCGERMAAEENIKCGVCNEYLPAKLDLLRIHTDPSDG